jgi:hypothetical protein
MIQGCRRSGQAEQCMKLKREWAVTLHRSLPRQKRSLDVYRAIVRTRVVGNSGSTTLPNVLLIISANAV